jgi:hypothetical protein
MIYMVLFVLVSKSVTDSVKLKLGVRCQRIQHTHTYIHGKLWSEAVSCIIMYLLSFLLGSVCFATGGDIENDHEVTYKIDESDQCRDEIGERPGRLPLRLGIGPLLLWTDLRSYCYVSSTEAK